MKTAKLSLDDVLQQIQSQVEQPTIETAREWGNRFPAYRDEITEFVCEWMFQASLSDEPAAFDQDLAYMRASSYLTNAVHTLRTQPDAVQGLILAAEKVSLNARALAKLVRANPAFIELLDKREIALESIPSSFLAALATALQVSVRSIANWMVSGAGGDRAPAFGTGEVSDDDQDTGKSFSHAWRDCGLSDEDLRYWQD